MNKSEQQESRYNLPYHYAGLLRDEYDIEYEHKIKYVVDRVNHERPKKILDVADYDLQTVPIEAYNRFKIYASMCNPCFDEIIHRAYKVEK